MIHCFVLIYFNKIIVNEVYSIILGNFHPPATDSGSNPGHWISSLIGLDSRSPLPEKLDSEASLSC